MAQVPHSRIITPPPSVISRVVKDLVISPPTAEELRVLTEIGTGIDTLVVEKVEAQLEGTQLLELLRIHSSPQDEVQQS